MKNEKNSDYLWSMSLSPKIDEGVHWFQLLLISFFTSCVILIVRMVSYTRPMEQFFWANPDNNLTDFFSYGKMIGILICAVLVIVLLLYRVFSQSLAIKKSVIYIPMLLYTAFVLISYFASDYKEFAWLGWNDRFEGTAVLLAYMLMLFYIINSVNTEKAVKWVVYPLGATSALLGLLGISQALDKDFFRTAIGQKLIVPNAMTDSGSTYWELINQAAAKGEQMLSFTFQNKEIYQTVYNINYVSFYLTLLIPLFGLLFINCMLKGKDEPIWKKILWGGLFAVQLFNLIGSASSGGFLGMAVVMLLALVLINKKILNWWKPLAILIVITIAIGGITYDRWLPELTNTFRVMHPTTQAATEKPETSSVTTEAALDSALEEAVASGQMTTEQALIARENATLSTDTQTEQTAKGRLDFFKTEGNDIILGYNGDMITFTTYPEDATALKIKDSNDKALTLEPTNVSPIYRITDNRFKTITIRPASDESNNNYIVVGTDGYEWPFLLSNSGVRYLNGIGNLVELNRVEAIGWKDNQAFGSGRGYIWSRTIPMMKETMLMGHGADTYCIYYPQNDYVGKYNSGTFSSVLNVIVDKPHNMYMGMWIGTGGVSVLAFLAMLLIYAIQSIRLLWRSKFEGFLDFTAAGIFLGIMGFAVTGFVDDSTVSVMPMFYGLLGTGIAINMMQKRKAAN